MEFPGRVYISKERLIIIDKEHMKKVVNLEEIGYEIETTGCSSIRTGFSLQSPRWKSPQLG